MLNGVFGSRRSAQVQPETAEQRLDNLLVFLQQTTDKAVLSRKDSKRLFNLAAPVLRESESPETLLALIKEMISPLQAGYSEYKTEPIEKLTAVLNGRRQIEGFKAQLKANAEPKETDVLEQAAPASPVKLL